MLEEHKLLEEKNAAKQREVEENLPNAKDDPAFDKIKQYIMKM